MAAKDICLHFRLKKDVERGVLVVHLASGARSAQADFAYDTGSKRLQGIVEGLEQNNCKLEQLRDIGVNLWSGLMSGAVGELVESIRGAEPEARFQLRLTLPPELEHLPWESLYFERDFDFGFVSSQSDHVVLRDPPESIRVAPPSERAPGPLKILVVIPMGSGLGVDREWHNFKLAVGKLEDEVELRQLAGRVTPDLLTETLHGERWDVVHFIGHGEQPESGDAKIRLNDEAGHGRWVSGEVFESYFRGSGVRLVVLNCCESAKTSPELRSLSGLGPYLLRARVPAVVAMRYEIRDDLAIDFSAKFYQALLHGPEPGRVDLAVEHARQALFRNLSEHSPARSFITPVLFLVAGCERLFEPVVTVPRPPAAAVPEPAAPTPAPRLVPEELARALREGRCVPVVGPRVLTCQSMRTHAPAAGPRQLASDLAARFEYPRCADFELCESAGDWMDLLLLQWICQHHAAEHEKEFYLLAEAIQNAYGSVQPPDFLSRLAVWNVPGIFYLYFDGLLEAAFEKIQRPVRAMTSVAQPVPPGSEPLLVQVRGSYRDADSLVLTERDHEKLWDQIGSMPKELVDLVRERGGRHLLFLGVNPRDPLVKRLTGKLLASRNVKRIFFVCHPGETADSYWGEFPVTWIEGELESVVGALSGN